MHLLQSKARHDPFIRQAAANDWLKFFEVQQEVRTTKGPDFLNHNVRRFVLFQTDKKKMKPYFNSFF